MRILTLAAAATLMAVQAQADIRVQFDEGAPKDRFTITRVGECALGASVVVLDLSKSPSGLIFDVSGSGQGVEVFQPFELVSGADYLTSQPTVRDGDQAIRLPLASLEQGDSVAFTIDVDDTGGGRESTVSDSEIEGAVVRVGTQDGSFGGAFGGDARADVRIGDGC